jgi:2'-5' RNA ligase
LTRLQSELQKTNADAKWIEPQNIHLTLKFLGDIPVEILPRIEQTITEIASRSAPFNVSLTEIGAFPDAKRPRTIWVGAKDDTGTLAGIAGAIKSAMINLGVEQEEHDFVAHITLGRIRGLRAQSRLSKALPTVSVTADLAQTVERLSLLKSQLSSEGPAYEVLNTYPLAG